MPSTERKLAAILSADVVGYSRLMAEDEAAGIPVTLIVPGAIRTNTLANALRGDGTFYGRVDKIFKEGMAVDRCAASILDTIERKKEEVMIASGEARRLVDLKRFVPALAARCVRLRKWP
jgi:short-subunit dehydrogenase